MCGNWNAKQPTSQQVFKVTTFCTDTWFQSFSPLINCIVRHALLKIGPCRNKTLPQLVRIADWYSIHAPLQHAAVSLYRYQLISQRSKIISSHNSSTKSLGSLLLIAYNTTLSSLLDKHAPVLTKLARRQSPSNPWFTPALRAFDLLSATLKTSGNAPTLLLTGLVLSLFAINTTT